MKYKHPDGRILYMSNSNTGGNDWGVFWNSSSGGSHRVKSIPLSTEEEIVRVKLVEYAAKNKCKALDDDEVQVSVIKNGQLDNKLSIIRAKSKAIVENFIEIGSVFIDIEDNKFYLEKGYINIVEMAHKEVNISKTTLYNLISVAKKFTFNGKLIEGFEKYNFSQLVELVSVPEKVIDKIEPGMPVKHIQQLKKDNKENKAVEKNEIKENEKQIIDDKNGSKGKADMFTCPDSEIMAKIPFPNFMCRECKKNNSCKKYRDKKDDIDKEIKENAGISLGETGGNTSLADIAKVELQKEKQDINDEKNKQLLQLTDTLLKNLKVCEADNTFILNKEAEWMLTQVGQIRVNLIERERQMKK